MSDFELIPLHITSFLIIEVISINHRLTSYWDTGKISEIFYLITINHRSGI
jgi:hypothetical protein